ncbi:MAG TPA: sigma-54-dependent Fis family transcriptional regulator [Thermodesulfobacteriaceae bacterium]|nr:sigma-54-dependent Fis family transcriptional regulator [Thermodesulfobacteriaceae bacterium]
MDLIIGNSSPIRRIKELICQVVDTDLNVLICGESGVGKELVALSLHNLSKRNKHQIVKVNCAALPGELLESELFGYEKGAFTGAVKSKPGKFEMANQGTMFLDEIGDMPLPLQAKLLQVLQDGAFARVGGLEEINVNAWVIAATNHDLEQDVQKGIFREDLFYRLNIIKIVVPPLRERKEDIPLLIEHLLNKHQSVSKGRHITISDRLKKIFSEYYWPGNVRELENYVRRIMVLGDSDALEEEILKRMDVSTRECSTSEIWAPDESLLNSVLENCKQEAQGKFPSLKEIKKKSVARIERIVIEEALRRTKGNRKQAAQLLQISYKALLYKIKDFKVKMPQKNPEEVLELKLPENTSFI